jgi:hypothetical protein
VRIASFAIVAALLAPALLLANDAYAHSMTDITGPLRIDTQTYFMKPGDSVIHDMEVCARFPDQLTVNNVTFTGNNSG